MSQDPAEVVPRTIDQRSEFLRRRYVAYLNQLSKGTTAADDEPVPHRRAALRDLRWLARRAAYRDYQALLQGAGEGAFDRQVADELLIGAEPRARRASA